MKLSTREFQLNMSKYLSKREEIVLTHYGKEIARIMPSVNTSVNTSKKSVNTLSKSVNTINEVTKNEPLVNITKEKLEKDSIGVSDIPMNTYFSPAPKPSKKGRK